MTYLPTTRSSLSPARDRKRRHISMVNSALALLNIEVKELMMAANMTEVSNPLKPENVQ